MSHADWCREEVLRARRGDGVGEVLPLGWRAEAWSLAFVCLAGLLLAALSLRAPVGTYFSAVVTHPAPSAEGVLSLSLEGRCGQAASLLSAKRRVEIRRRTAFGAWRQMAIRSAPACGAGDGFTLTLEPESLPLAAGTSVLVRIPNGRRPLFSRLGELLSSARPLAKNAG